MLKAEMNAHSREHLENCKKRNTELDRKLSALARTANITEERRKPGDKPRLANNYDSGGGNTQTAPVTGKPIDPMDCR